MLLERATSDIRPPRLLGASLVVLGVLVATVPAVTPTTRATTQSTTMEMAK